MTKLLCIIPFYNEEFRFSSTFENLFQQYSTIDFLLVDDGSTDNTLAILQTLSNNHQNCTVLSLPKNVGKAEAIRNGVLNSVDKNYNFIGYLDADLATPIHEFIKLYEFLLLHDSLVFIMGSRIKLIGNKVDRSLLRHYLGRVFATIVSHFILKTPVYDTQCGAKIIDAKWCSLLFEKPFETKWLFDVELLLRLKNNGNNLQKCVAEIPLFEWKEIGNSKIKVSDFIKVPFQLVKLYFNSNTKLISK